MGHKFYKIVENIYKNDFITITIIDYYCIVNKSLPNSLNWAIASESRHDISNKWINRGSIIIFKDMDPILVAILLVIKPMWMAFAQSALNHREKNIAA